MKKTGKEKQTSKASWRILCRPTGMPSKLSMVVVIQRSSWRIKSSLAPALDYIAAMTYIEAHQAQHATLTQLSLQAIQGFKNDGRDWTKISWYLGLVIIFWSCFGRCHLQIKPLVGILALLILPMGWLHADGKSSILSIYSLTKNIGLNSWRLIYPFLLILGT